MGRTEMIRIEQLRQENERLQEKIAEYQRKELEDIRSYARLSAENISLRQQQPRSNQPSGAEGGDATAAAATGNPKDDETSGDKTLTADAAVDVANATPDKDSWELARLNQTLDRKEQEKRNLIHQVNRLKKEIINEREKRLRLERIMVSAGMDLGQLTDDEVLLVEDDDDDRKGSRSPRPSKTYKERKRSSEGGAGGSSGMPKVKYNCPIDGCAFVMLFSTQHNPPLDEHGNVSDKQAWPLPLRNNALRMRRHMEEFHPEVPKEDFPAGFSKKMNFNTPSGSKRARQEKDDAGGAAAATTTVEYAAEGGESTMVDVTMGNVV